MKTIKYIIILITLLSLPFLCLSDGSITYKKGQHVPLIFIIDQTDEEDPSKLSLASTQTLDLGIEAQNAAILVSRSILYNFIYRKQDWNNPTQPDNKKYKNTAFSDQDWELYIPENLQYFTNDNQLYLLIPKTKKNLFIQAFNLKTLQKLPILTPGKKDDYSKLVTQLTPTGVKSKAWEEKQLDLMPQDLEKIFTTFHQKESWEKPILDIYLHGHGAPEPDPEIASLTPAEIQKLLTFFNNKLRIGILIVSSCFAGGKNLRNFRFKKDINDDEIFYALNFIIIAQSVGDIPIYVLTDKYLLLKGKSFFKSIFEITQDLGASKHTLQNLLQALTDPYLEGLSIHAESNIPQIILPGGIEIQSLTPDDNVMVLGNVKVKTAELENKPIYIKPQKIPGSLLYDFRLNVLIYPEIINIPLIVYSSNVKPSFNLKLWIEKQWENLPTFTEYINKHLKASKNANLYPNILSMIHGDASHYFNKLVFQGNAFDGYGGILMGIRDSFLNLEKRPTKKNFYIDTLEGPNDISLILKAIQMIEGRKTSRLEKELPGDGKNLVLHNVSITTQAEFWMTISIKFQINKTAWKFSYSGLHWRPEEQALFKPNLWDFKKINANKYENKYRKLRDNIINRSLQSFEEQKPLVTILQEKIAKIKAEKTLTINSLFELSSTLGQLARMR